MGKSARLRRDTRSPVPKRSTTCSSRSSLVCPDVVFANHLAPALEVAGHDLVEARIAEPGRLEAELPQPRRDFRRKHGLADVERDLLEKRLRSRGRCEDAVPRFDADPREHAVEGR